MEEFVDNVRILINALGYKVLDAYTNAIPKEDAVGETEKKEDLKAISGACHKKYRKN